MMNVIYCLDTTSLCSRPLFGYSRLFSGSFWTPPALQPALFGHRQLFSRLFLDTTSLYSWLFWDTASRFLFLLGEDARAANFFFCTCYVLFGTQLGKLPLDESFVQRVPLPKRAVTWQTATRPVVVYTWSASLHASATVYVVCNQVLCAKFAQSLLRDLTTHGVNLFSGVINEDFARTQLPQLVDDGFHICVIHHLRNLLV